MTYNTFSSGQAYIEIGGKTAGWVRNLSFSENTTRVQVRGLGKINLQEAPAVQVDCSWSADMFFLDFTYPALQEMMNRNATVQQIIDTLTLGELTFSIVAYKKQIVSRNDAKIVTSVDNTGKTIAMLSPCVINTQSFNIAEGGVAGYNVSGLYFNPISIVENA